MCPSQSLANFPHRGPQPVTQSGLTPLHICPSRHDDSGPCPKSGRERTSVDPCPSGVTQSEVTTFCSLLSGGTRTPYGAGYERGASLSLFASGPRGLSGGHGSGQRKNGPWRDGAIEPLASFGGKNDQGFHGLKQDVSLKRGEVAVTGCGLRGQQAGPSCAVSRRDRRHRLGCDNVVTQWVVTQYRMDGTWLCLFLRTNSCESGSGRWRAPLRAVRPAGVTGSAGWRVFTCVCPVGRNWRGSPPPPRCPRVPVSVPTFGGGGGPWGRKLRPPGHQTRLH